MMHGCLFLCSVPTPMLHTVYVPGVTGYSWEFCGCGGAGGVQQGNPPEKGDMDCGGYPRPESLNRDYGTPKGICQETEPGIFVREWVRERANRMRIRFPFCQQLSGTRVSTLWSFLPAISVNLMNLSTGADEGDGDN
jgi:hypothetical protein